MKYPGKRLFTDVFAQKLLPQDGGGLTRHTCTKTLHASLTS